MYVYIYKYIHAHTNVCMCVPYMFHPPDSGLFPSWITETSRMGFQVENSVLIESAQQNSQIILYRCVSECWGNGIKTCGQEQGYVGINVKSVIFVDYDSPFKE